MATVTAKQLREALSTIEFPAGKAEILEAARRQGAEEEVLKALRTLPRVDYRSVAEVVASVKAPVDSGLTPEQHAVLARNKRDQEVAEALRRPPPD
jgi:hypothetical protein